MGTAMHARGFAGPGGHLTRCRILTIFRVFVELKFGSIAIYLANHPAWIAHCKHIFGQTS